MKKLLLSLVFVLVLSGSAFAGSKIMDSTAVSDPTSDIVTLNATYSRHMVSCVIVDADTSISAVALSMYASNDKHGTADADAEWHLVATHTFTSGEITALKAAFWVKDAPADRIKVVVAETGVGAGDNIKIWYANGVE